MNATYIVTTYVVIETVNSQLEKMGLQRLHARTNSGLAPKVLASLLALTFSNVL